MELLRNTRGVTAVEFGLLALPFFSIIGAILQTSLVFLSGQVLESAVNDAGRTIRTGQVQAAGVTIDAFRADVCSRLFGLFPDCSGLFIKVSEISNFQSATITVPIDEATCETSACDWSEAQSFSPGVGKSIVVVKVYYKYPVFLQIGPFGMANLPNGTRLLGAATVFQNEPFT
ncbi:pilus assembly protein [Devosia sp. PTR5]|uniref:Pilus assembly protein n=1 Tax=Devosia oryzisoli TaxID=2774138 RepID=A0A927FVQ3_9HYPH|nr:pilus assembly protein [Devosia oryzisoli]